jgi:response regulator RpfG family c-di-GMP phosphodiesterase
MDNTEAEFQVACDEVGIAIPDKEVLYSFLALLRNKNAITHTHYLHSLRVGLLSRKIARLQHCDERALLMAGALHDLGKCQVCGKVLGKSDSWSASDTKEIKRHVMDGYRTLRGRFDFTAETMVRHHSFQYDRYPKKLPPFLHSYSATTKKLIIEYGRIVALADVYDALHRVNDKFGEKRALSGEEIKVLMFELNGDKTELVSDLYETGILSV